MTDKPLKFSVKPEVGIHENIPADIYFSWQAFSKSMVAATMRSAKHLNHYLKEDKKSDAMVMGSLVDAMLLEPDELSKYEINPAMYINSKNKEMPFTERSNWCKDHIKTVLAEGRIPVYQADWDKAELIQKAVIENPAAEKLLSTGKTQVAIVWDDEETGIRCKGRIDNMNDEAINDLKTTRDGSLWSFARDVVKFGYHTQAGMYTDGLIALGEEPRPFNFITVENKEPYGCAVYNIDDESTGAGCIRYKIALKRYKDYLENDPGFKKGYSDFIEPLKIPTWEIELAFKAGDVNDVGI